MQKEGTEKQIKVLKDLRSELGMNRTVFAKEMGIPLRTIEQWEAGERKMPDYLLRFLVYYALGRKILFRDGDNKYVELMENKYN